VRAAAIARPARSLNSWRRTTRTVQPRDGYRASSRVIPCHNQTTVAHSCNRKALMQGFSMGGTGLEPVTPSLSIWSDRSRQFAQVRSSRTVERNLLRDRTLERARTNADPCQSCHARWDLHAASIPLLRVVHHLPMNTAAHGAQRLVRICIKRRRTGTCSCWRRAVLQPTVRSACEWVSRSAGCDDVARSSAARKCSPSAAFSALRFARREPR
jgi:hypothetical protein